MATQALVISNKVDMQQQDELLQKSATSPLAITGLAGGALLGATTAVISQRAFAGKQRWWITTIATLCGGIVGHGTSTLASYLSNEKKLTQ